MPILTIQVEDLPEPFRGGSLRLLLQTKTGHAEGELLRFAVPYELRPDRQGVLQPYGDAVQKQPDGRRFVYLVWAEATRMVGRMKIQFDALSPEQIAQGASVTVSATDAKGRPACGSVPVRSA